MDVTSSAGGAVTAAELTKPRALIRSSKAGSILCRAKPQTAILSPTECQYHLCKKRLAVLRREQYLWKIRAGKIPKDVTESMSSLHTKKSFDKVCES